MHISENLKTLGMIPARFGSTRFPGKPLALIDGKTLIQRTYENSLKCTFLNEVVVATDDKRIFDHVVDFGGKAIMTSSHCLNGTERLAEAIRENRQLDVYDIIINIQGDEPLLEPDVIEKVTKVLIEDHEAAMSTAVVLMKTEEEAMNFSVIKCAIDQNHNALYFSRNLIPSGHKGAWQADVVYYKHIGIYGYKRDFLLQYANLNATPLQLAEDLEQLKVLEHGYKIKVALVESASIGIDNPEDINKIRQFL